MRQGTLCQASFTAQVTIYGPSSVSKSTEIQPLVFPNPANEMVTIRFPLNAGHYRALVFNGRGSLVKEVVLEGTDVNLSVKDLQAGIYEILVTDGERRHFQQRLIVCH